jgi:hypothetical protein
MEKCLFCGKIMKKVYSENEQNYMECPNDHYLEIFSPGNHLKKEQALKED